VGACIGFSLVAVGTAGVNWSQLGMIGEYDFVTFPGNTNVRAEFKILHHKTGGNGEQGNEITPVCAALR